MLSHIGHQQPQQQLSGYGCCVQLLYREAGEQGSSGLVPCKSCLGLWHLRTSMTNLEEATTKYHTLPF